jgi:hypothetical protein
MMLSGCFGNVMLNIKALEADYSSHTLSVVVVDTPFFKDRDR